MDLNVSTHYSVNGPIISAINYMIVMVIDVIDDDGDQWRTEGISTGGWGAFVPKFTDETQ